jgi:diguanylate cyclase (GGDEF)-like protein/PAS domain S-box-containing protein
LGTSTTRVGGIHESCRALPKQGGTTVNAPLPGQGKSTVAATTPPVVSCLDAEVHTRQFWSHYLRVGILVFTVEALASLLYLAATPHGPHRLFLIVMSSFVVVVLTANIPFTGRVAAAPWRTNYSFAWTLLAGAILALSIYLDGGLDSPMFALLTLPIVSAALALEVRQVIVCGVASLGEFTFLWLTIPVLHRSTAEIAMFAMALVGLVVIAVGVSNARTRLMDDEKRLRAELSTLATVDALTGCLNHGAFYERLDVEIDRALRQGQPLSLLMIDIDLFKAFNDAYGHVAGDDALSCVGTTLNKLSRSFDVVGRVGGDEFAVALPTSTLENAAQIAVRMTRALTSAHRPSVSVGYAALDSSRPDATQLVREADQSLYEAKLSGRSRTSESATFPAQPKLRDLPQDDRASREATEERIRANDRASADALAILDAYQSTSNVGLGFVDRDFRYVRVNPMLAAIHGGTATEQLGRTIEEIVPNLWPQLEPMYRSVIETNTPVTNGEVVATAANESGVRSSWLVNLYPVTIEDDVIGVGIVVIDVTEWRRTAEDRLVGRRPRVARPVSAPHLD